MNLYWGDLHNHNGVGVGKGSLDRSYAIAEGTLDFYAFTPHGWWPDITSDDPGIRDYHLAGFEVVKKSWDKVVARANERDKPGGFVALVAYEWHSSAWGDYCVYYPGAEGDLFYARDIEELKIHAAKTGSLILPHHCAYRKGWRGTDWAAHDSRLSPVAEVFSEHGNSLEPSSHIGMYRHSMGGADESQSVLAQINAGKVLGLTAGTDDHFGHPGCYGEGLTGLYAEGLTRDDVWDAIKKRHTYGVTGDRIELNVSMAGGMMGDVLPASTTRTLHVDAAAFDTIDYVEVIKNGKSVQKWSPPGHDPVSEPRELIRCEWGWGGMKSTDKTVWNIRLKHKYGKSMNAVPCFCGGPDVLDFVNRVEQIAPDKLAVQSATCRSNFLPTHAVNLLVAGSPAIDVDLRGTWGKKPFRCQVSFDPSDLTTTGQQVQIDDVFSSPRFKVHRLVSYEDRQFSEEWEDSEPGQNDFYLVKVLQKNGHMAWSSPIWCREDTNG